VLTPATRTCWLVLATVEVTLTSLTCVIATPLSAGREEVGTFVVADVAALAEEF